MELRAACAVGDREVVLDGEIALSGDWETDRDRAGPLQLADGTTLRGGTLRGWGLLVEDGAMLNAYKTYQPPLRFCLLFLILFLYPYEKARKSSTIFLRNRPRNLLKSAETFIFSFYFSFSRRKRQNGVGVGMLGDT